MWGWGMGKGVDNAASTSLTFFCMEDFYFFMMFCISSQGQSRHLSGTALPWLLVALGLPGSAAVCSVG